MFYMVGAFDLRLSGATVADAEHHYLERHVPLARRLPGLRAYVIGTVAETRRISAERRRGAILAFESEAAWREAYRSSVGRELREDEKRLIADPRVLLLHGEEIIPAP
ncbi:MAG: EthD family reductase [Candidatus Rokubacteria bacterium]|nr:EthD family reductase [Candidatus Rokubacteria bacterium]